MTESTQAHSGQNATWRDATPPDVTTGKTMGSLRSCSYCGSMHPADVAAAIRAGACGSWADFKYGWPHKAYFAGVPNPHAGMPESRSSCSNPDQSEIDAGKWVQVPDGFDKATGQPVSRWVGAPTPAAAFIRSKFYTEHLQEATPEDRDVIERHLGLRFTFDADGVHWMHVEQ